MYHGTVNGTLMVHLKELVIMELTKNGTLGTVDKKFEFHFEFLKIIFENGVPSVPFLDKVMIINKLRCTIHCTIGVPFF